MVTQTQDSEHKKDRFIASHLLTAVGDAIGYWNGKFEFCYSTSEIHKRFNEHTDNGSDLSKIPIAKLRVSDDTVMAIATAKALLTLKDKELSFHELITNLAREYVLCMEDMSGRAPGPTTMAACNQIKKRGYELWDTMPYNPRGGGCGGSMRSMCIGLLFHEERDRDMLIKTAIESGRLTHNQATGFLGALVSSVFTAFAVAQIPPKLWGHKFRREIMPRARRYLRDESKRDWDTIDKDARLFESKFGDFLKMRNIHNGTSEPVFPAEYKDHRYRDALFESWSFSGWAGASGDDSVMIAYDTLLYSQQSFKRLLYTSVLHRGDNDSTGAIAFAWYGALYGFPQKYPVVRELAANVEYADLIRRQAEQLFGMSKKRSVSKSEPAT